MMTPYAWDPLGLQGKLYPFICDCVDMRNELLYYRLKIMRLMNGEVTFKHIIRLLHSFLCIEWIEEKGTLPPVNIFAMALWKNKDMEMAFFNILDEYKKVNVTHADMSRKNEYKFLMDAIRSRLETMENDKNYYREYQWEKIQQNKEIVKRINKVVFMSMDSAPQIKGEKHIKWNDLIAM